MNQIALILSMVYLLFACTSLPKEETQNCLPEMQVSNVLGNLEKVADINADLNNIPKTKSALVGTSCNKRVYEKNSYRLLIYQNPVAASGTVQGSLSSKEKVGSKECLSAAVSEAERLSPSFTKIIGLHRQKWAWLWDDYDIGPAKWLNCKDRKSTAWFESIATLVHELNHEIREGSCIRFAGNTSKLCFELNPKLPLRSLAKLETFPTKDTDQQAVLTFFQRTYLTDLDQPPLFLFDELNSYILTTRAYSKTLENKGDAALFDGEHRPAVVLPLFLLYGVLYVERLSKLHPDWYYENFVSNSKNITALKDLLNEGESTYKSWILILKKIHKPQKDIEENLWENYLTERSKINL